MSITLKKRVELFEVTHCGVCPWVIDNHSDPDQPWRCDGNYDQETGNPGLGWPRELLPWPGRSPPSWCPLRKAERLVRLKEGV